MPSHLARLRSFYVLWISSLFHMAQSHWWQPLLGKSGGLPHYFFSAVNCQRQHSPSFLNPDTSDTRRLMPREYQGPAQAVHWGEWCQEAGATAPQATRPKLLPTPSYEAAPPPPLGNTSLCWWQPRSHSCLTPTVAAS